ncbi:MAG: L-2,4-diaminobutyric acid acetyltransferase [Verrucomicrobiales bacterium]
MELLAVANPEKLPDALTIGTPALHDAVVMHRLAEKSGVLDVNSRYAYLLCVHLFQRSCRVVRNQADEVLGFVTAIVDPEASDTLFVWQVTIDQSARGQQLGAKMIVDIISTLQVRYVEATVTPSNAPSARMFARIADLLDADIHRSAGFAPELFAPEEHEAEELVRIGPVLNNIIHLQESL